MSHKSDIETEIKLRLPGGLAEMRRKIEARGFRVVKRRVFESNVLFDTIDLALERKHELIRLRRVGSKCVLTFKGPSQPGKYKSREEIETGVADAARLEKILARLGFVPVFQYDKFRTEYGRERDSGTITVDETPIGKFLELEGAPDWIDGVAAELGFSALDYITQSYGTLFLAYCEKHGIAPTNMVYP